VEHARKLGQEARVAGKLRLSARQLKFELVVQ
jgi:hypothetical protein